MSQLPETGSPADRGSADACFRRPFDPHKWEKGKTKNTRVKLTDPVEIEEYRAGYMGEENRKYETYMPY